jgi:hypothetical protein
MQKHTGYSADILNEAERLVAEAQRTLEEKAQLRADMGLDMAKATAAMGPKEAAQLEQAVAADLADVEREVAQRALALGLMPAGATTGGAKKMRPMV